MTKLESKKQTLNCYAKTIYDFVSDSNNIIKLLPEDKIENWISTKKSCSFHIKGLTTLSIEIFEKEEFSFVKYKNSSEKPFSFELLFIIEQTSNETSETLIILNADLNTTLKFLISTPLNNLLEIMNNNIKSAL